MDKEKRDNDFFGGKLPPYSDEDWDKAIEKCRNITGLDMGECMGKVQAQFVIMWAYAQVIEEKK